MMPNIPEHVEDNANVRDTLKNLPFNGSQIVESKYPSAIAGAVLWEWRNGEVFNAETPVGDRRLDMWENCHRIGC